MRFKYFFVFCRSYDEFSQEGSAASYHDDDDAASYDAELREYGYNQRERRDHTEERSVRGRSGSPHSRRRSSVSPASSRNQSISPHSNKYKGSKYEENGSESEADDFQDARLRSIASDSYYDKSKRRQSDKGNSPHGSYRSTPASPGDKCRSQSLSPVSRDRRIHSDSRTNTLPSSPERYSRSNSSDCKKRLSSRKDERTIRTEVKEPERLKSKVIVDRVRKLKQESDVDSVKSESALDRKKRSHDLSSRESSPAVSKLKSLPSRSRQESEQSERTHSRKSSLIGDGAIPMDVCDGSGKQCSDSCAKDGKVCHRDKVHVFSTNVGDLSTGDKDDTPTAKKPKFSEISDSCRLKENSALLKSSHSDSAKLNNIDSSLSYRKQMEAFRSQEQQCDEVLLSPQIKDEKRDKVQNAVRRDENEDEDYSELSLSPRDIPTEFLAKKRQRLLEQDRRGYRTKHGSDDQLSSADELETMHRRALEPRERKPKRESPLSLPLPKFAHDSSNLISSRPLSPQVQSHTSSDIPKKDDSKDTTHREMAVQGILSPPTIPLALKSPPPSLISPPAVSPGIKSPVSSCSGLKSPTPTSISPGAKALSGGASVEKGSGATPASGKSPAHASLSSVPDSSPDVSPMASPLGFSLEDRIKALDEKLAKQQATEIQMSSALDYNTYKKLKKRPAPELKREPSDIMKALLSKTSIFDQDFRRLEQVSEKYESKEVTELPQMSRTPLAQLRSKTTSNDLTDVSAASAFNFANRCHAFSSSLDSQLSKSNELLSPSQTSPLLLGSLSRANDFRDVREPGEKPCDPRLSSSSTVSEPNTPLAKTHPPVIQLGTIPDTPTTLYGRYPTYPSNYPIPPTPVPTTTTYTTGVSSHSSSVATVMSVTTPVSLTNHVTKPGELRNNNTSWSGIPITGQARMNGPVNSYSTSSHMAMQPTYGQYPTYSQQSSHPSYCHQTPHITQAPTSMSLTTTSGSYQTKYGFPTKRSSVDQPLQHPMKPILKKEPCSLSMPSTPTVKKIDLVPQQPLVSALKKSEPSTMQPLTPILKKTDLVTSTSAPLTPILKKCDSVTLHTSSVTPILKKSDNSSQSAGAAPTPVLKREVSTPHQLSSHVQKKQEPPAAPTKIESLFKPDVTPQVKKELKDTLFSKETASSAVSATSVLGKRQFSSQTSCDTDAVKVKTEHGSSDEHSKTETKNLESKSKPANSSKQDSKEPVKKNDLAKSEVKAEPDAKKQKLSHSHSKENVKEGKKITEKLEKQKTTEKKVKGKHEKSEKKPNSETMKPEKPEVVKATEKEKQDSSKDNKEKKLKQHLPSDDTKKEKDKKDDKDKKVQKKSHKDDKVKSKEGMHDKPKENYKEKAKSALKKDDKKQEKRKEPITVAEKEKPKKKRENRMEKELRDLLGDTQQPVFLSMYDMVKSRSCKATKDAEKEQREAEERKKSVSATKKKKSHKASDFSDETDSTGQPSDELPEIEAKIKTKSKQNQKRKSHHIDFSSSEDEDGAPSPNFNMFYRRNRNIKQNSFRLNASDVFSADGSSTDNEEKPVPAKSTKKVTASKREVIQKERKLKEHKKPIENQLEYPFDAKQEKVEVVKKAKREKENREEKGKIKKSKDNHIHKVECHKASVEKAVEVISRDELSKEAKKKHKEKTNEAKTEKKKEKKEEDKKEKKTDKSSKLIKEEGKTEKNQKKKVREEVLKTDKYENKKLQKKESIDESRKRHFSGSSNSEMSVKSDKHVSDVKSKLTNDKHSTEAQKHDSTKNDKNNKEIKKTDHQTPEKKQSRENLWRSLFGDDNTSDSGVSDAEAVSVTSGVEKHGDRIAKSQDDSEKKKDKKKKKKVDKEKKKMDKKEKKKGHKKDQKRDDEKEKTAIGEKLHHGSYDSKPTESKKENDISHDLSLSLSDLTDEEQMPKVERIKEETHEITFDIEPVMPILGSPQNIDADVPVSRTEEVEADTSDGTIICEGDKPAEPVKQEIQKQESNVSEDAESVKEEVTSKLSAEAELEKASKQLEMAIASILPEDTNSFVQQSQVDVKEGETEENTESEVKEEDLESIQAAELLLEGGGITVANQNEDVSRRDVTKPKVTEQPPVNSYEVLDTPEDDDLEEEGELVIDMGEKLDEKPKHENEELMSKHESKASDRTSPEIEKPADSMVEQTCSIKPTEEKAPVPMKIGVDESAAVSAPELDKDDKEDKMPRKRGRKPKSRNSNSESKLPACRLVSSETMASFTTTDDDMPDLIRLASEKAPYHAYFESVSSEGELSEKKDVYQFEEETEAKLFPLRKDKDVEKQEAEVSKNDGVDNAEAKLDTEASEALDVTETPMEKRRRGRRKKTESESSVSLSATPVKVEVENEAPPVLSKENDDVFSERTLSPDRRGTAEAESLASTDEINQEDESRDSEDSKLQYATDVPSPRTQMKLRSTNKTTRPGLVLKSKGPQSPDRTPVRGPGRPRSNSSAKSKRQEFAKSARAEAVEDPDKSSPEPQLETFASSEERAKHPAMPVQSTVDKAAVLDSKTLDGRRRSKPDVYDFNDYCEEVSFCHAKAVTVPAPKAHTPVTVATTVSKTPTTSVSTISLSSCATTVNMSQMPTSSVFSARNSVDDVINDVALGKFEVHVEHIPSRRRHSSVRAKTEELISTNSETDEIRVERINDPTDISVFTAIERTIDNEMAKTLEGQQPCKQSGLISDTSDGITVSVAEETRKIDVRSPTTVKAESSVDMSACKSCEKSSADKTTSNNARARTENFLLATMPLPLSAIKPDTGKEVKPQVCRMQSPANVPQSVSDVVAAIHQDVKGRKEREAHVMQVTEAQKSPAMYLSPETGLFIPVENAGASPALPEKEKERKIAPPVSSAPVVVKSSSPSPKVEIKQEVLASPAVTHQTKVAGTFIPPREDELKASITREPGELPVKHPKSVVSKASSPKQAVAAPNSIAVTAMTISKMSGGQAVPVGSMQPCVYNPIPAHEVPIGHHLVEKTYPQVHGSAIAGLLQGQYIMQHKEGREGIERMSGPIVRGSVSQLHPGVGNLTPPHTPPTHPVSQSDQVTMMRQQLMSPHPLMRHPAEIGPYIHPQFMYPHGQYIPGQPPISMRVDTRSPRMAHPMEPQDQKSPGQRAHSTEPRPDVVKDDTKVLYDRKRQMSGAEKRARDQQLQAQQEAEAKVKAAMEESRRSILENQRQQQAKTTQEQNRTSPIRHPLSMAQERERQMAEQHHRIAAEQHVKDMQRMAAASMKGVPAQYPPDGMVQHAFVDGKLPATSRPSSAHGRLPQSQLSPSVSMHPSPMSPNIPRTSAAQVSPRALQDSMSPHVEGKTPTSLSLSFATMAGVSSTAPPSHGAIETKPKSPYPPHVTVDSKGMPITDPRIFPGPFLAPGKGLPPQGYPPHLDQKMVEAQRLEMQRRMEAQQRIGLSGGPQAQMTAQFSASGYPTDGRMPFLPASMEQHPSPRLTSPHMAQAEGLMSRERGVPDTDRMTPIAGKQLQRVQNNISMEGVMQGQIPPPDFHGQPMMQPEATPRPVSQQQAPSVLLPVKVSFRGVLHEVKHFSKS